MTKPNSIDQYIANSPEEVQPLLQQIRATIKAAAPQATEVISYGMPAFKMTGILVYFAVGKHHIGFYPTPSGIQAFQKELSIFKSGKGSVQFPLDQPLPLELITRIVEFRVAEDLEKTRLKK